jgi:inositol 3-alpha-galactosyltransferase
MTFTNLTQPLFLPPYSSSQRLLTLISITQSHNQICNTTKMADNAARHNAYATLITRDSYLPGVIILAYTLKRNSSIYPLVVLYTPNLPKDAKRLLELEAPKCNMILRECQHLLPPEGVKMTLIAERFADTWTKLRVFELFEYDAVCYLDADMAVLDNMDVVFQVETHLPDDWIAANHVCVCNLDSDSWAPEDWRAENCAYTPLEHPTALMEPLQPTETSPSPHKLLNGGMFIFHPSEGLWDRMLDVFNTTPLLSTFMFPDQDFLAFFFVNKWYALGWQYNAIKTMRYWHPNIWRDEEVICLHYIVDKPWAKRVGLDGVAGYKGLDGVTHCWWWQLYQYWEDERTSDGRGGNEAIALLKKLIAPADTMEGGLGYLQVGLPVRA